MPGNAEQNDFDALDRMYRAGEQDIEQGLRTIGTVSRPIALGVLALACLGGIDGLVKLF